MRLVIRYTNKGTMSKILFILMFLPIAANAAPRGAFDVTKTYLNEGQTRVGLAVACSSSAWTSVLPTGITRRAAVLHTLSTASETVCLSTITATAITCTSDTAGIHLEKGGTYIDNSEDVLYCKVATGSAITTAYSVYLYGMVYRDSKDDGDLTN